MPNEKCLIQLYGSEGVCFLGCHGEFTPDIHEALIFTDELEAYTFIDKHGLHHLAKVRIIHSSAD